MFSLAVATLLTAVGAGLWGILLVVRSDSGRHSDIGLSPQSVLVDQKRFAVLGSRGVFRTGAFDSAFNPHNATPPFFQIFDKSFLSVLGKEPSLCEVASNDTFAFAHEAPIYVDATGELFFSSNGGGHLGYSDWDNNNQVANNSFSGINVPVKALDLADSSVQMTNGGTGPYKTNLLLINSGRGYQPPNIAVVNSVPPYNATILLDNYYGRQFNSLNDIKIHPSGMLFFTDVTYGYLNHFRPLPQLPNHVYRFDPDTGSVRVVADGFSKPNGLAFTSDGKTAYIADTGAVEGFMGLNQTLPATIYAFNVDPNSHTFSNRRVLAYVDSGVPDGVQVDTRGNIYAGCGDGVHVWNSEGTLIGKFFLGMSSANLVFAGKGRLFILAETKVFLARIAADGVKVSWP